MFVNANYEYGRNSIRLFIAVGSQNFRTQFEVTNGLANRDSQMFRVNHARNFAAASQPFVRQGQEVVVLGEFGSFKLGGACENLIVVGMVSAVFRSRQDIHASAAKALGK